MNPVLESILPNVEALSRNINEDSAATYVENFRPQEHWLASSPVDFIQLNERERLHFLFVLHILDFELDSWKFEGKTNTWALIAALEKAREQDILKMETLTGITTEQLQEILPNISNVETRARMLRETGLVIQKEFKGALERVIREGNHDAVGILRVLTRFPCFKEPLYPRAQAFISDTATLFSDTEWNISNTTELTASASNELVTALQSHNILASTIETPAQAAIWTVEHLKALIIDHYPHTTAQDIGRQLWLEVTPRQE